MPDPKSSPVLSSPKVESPFLAGSLGFQGGLARRPLGNFRLLVGFNSEQISAIDFL